MLFGKIKIPVILILFLTSCVENPKQEQTKSSGQDLSEEVVLESSQQEAPIVTDSTTLAMQWLEEGIEAYFHQERNDWNTITTASYSEFKGDLINAVYEHGIDIDSLKKKWAHKYDFTSEDIGVGFLIGAQDYGEIEVESCKPILNQGNTELRFKVVLYDTLFKSYYESDITVVPYRGSFAIDAVEEHYK